MKMIDHNHFICHLILGTFTEYPEKDNKFFYIQHFFYYISRIKCNNYGYAHFSSKIK